MLGQKMQDAINRQIGEEFNSAYLYLSMAAYFESIGLPGMATWMQAQATEEVGHGMKFFAHINERGGRVELPAIDKPQVEWKSPLEAFKAALEHEKYITDKIHSLVDLAHQEKDHAAGIMLQWFVTEQVEEEDSAQTIVDTLERIGDAGHGLIMLDRELGRRPAPAGAAGGAE